MMFNNFVYMRTQYWAPLFFHCWPKLIYKLNATADNRIYFVAIHLLFTSHCMPSLAGCAARDDFWVGPIAKNIDKDESYEPYSG